jgi:hypothetical protein
MWDVPSQSFVTYGYALGKWRQGGTVVDPIINPGEAFYCQLNTASPLSIPFTGTASTSPTPIPGFTPTTLDYLLGSQTYDPTPGATYNYYDITGYAPVAGVSLFVPDGTAISGTPYSSPLEWNQYEYDGTSWHFGSSTGPVTSEPQILLAEGVWIGPSEVPEPTTMIAGALLLLPFGASILRLLCKTRTA